MLLSTWRQTWAQHTLWAWLTWNEAMQLRALCREARNDLVPQTLHRTPSWPQGGAVHVVDWCLAAMGGTTLPPAAVQALVSSLPFHRLYITGPDPVPWVPGRLSPVPDAGRQWPQALRWPVPVTWTSMQLSSVWLAVAQLATQCLDDLAAAKGPPLPIEVQYLEVRPAIMSTPVLELKMMLRWEHWLPRVLQQWPRLHTIKATACHHDIMVAVLPPLTWSPAVHGALHTLELDPPRDVASWTPWLRGLASLPSLRSLMWNVPYHLAATPAALSAVAAAWQTPLPRLEELNWGKLNMWGLLPWVTVTPVLRTLAGTWKAPPRQRPVAADYPATLHHMTVAEVDPHLDVWKIMSEIPATVLSIQLPSFRTFKLPSLPPTPVRQWQCSLWWSPPLLPVHNGLHTSLQYVDWRPSPIHSDTTAYLADALLAAPWPALEHIRLHLTLVSPKVTHTLTRALVQARAAGHLPRCHTWQGLHVGLPLTEDMWGPLNAAPAPAPRLTLHVSYLDAPATAHMAMWAGVSTLWAAVKTLCVVAHPYYQTLPLLHELCDAIQQDAAGAARSLRLPPVCHVLECHVPRSWDTQFDNLHKLAVRLQHLQQQNPQWRGILQVIEPPVTDT